MEYLAQQQAGGYQVCHTVRCLLHTEQEAEWACGKLSTASTSRSSREALRMHC